MIDIRPAQKGVVVMWLHQNADILVCVVGMMIALLAALYKGAGD